MTSTSSPSLALSHLDSTGWGPTLAHSPLNVLGNHIDQVLQSEAVGLMMGGEPTFVAAAQLDLPEWNTQALGPEKRRLAEQLLWELRDRLGIAQGLLHTGIGKQYPGEGEVRWALGCYWRTDGQPLWRDARWLVKPPTSDQSAASAENRAEPFIQALVRGLGLSPDHILTAYEVGAQEPAGYSLPLLAIPAQVDEPTGPAYWASCAWTLPEAVRWQEDDSSLVLVATIGPIGLRLPLQGLPEAELVAEVEAGLTAAPIGIAPTPLELPDNSIRIALTVEMRGDELCVFLPPLGSARSFVDLVAQVETIAAQLQTPVRLEGYVPPRSCGIEGFQITPDPGVIEVNVHPAATWPELCRISQTLYEAAGACGLIAHKYAYDGRLIPTGGGAHITLGGISTLESPLLRRPDLLRSFISYWQNHPSLSYLFAGLFVGPTSQSPRVDEARHETLYELELAFQALQPGQSLAPAIIDRLLGNLLIDVTGNTHRAAFCIDKLFPIRNPHLQLGLLEFRFFEMPPLPWMHLLELLLIRAFVAWFWLNPYREPLQRWGTTLHDRFFLPHYLIQDFKAVLADLAAAGYALDWAWFEPLLDFRCPVYGCLEIDRPGEPPLSLELRHALESWPVLGEDSISGTTSRAVDSSMERIQVTLRGGSDRYQVLCNGHAVPLILSSDLGESAEFVGAVRFRARCLGAMLNPFVDPHAPLEFAVVDCQTQAVLGACRYHSESLDGSPYLTIPKDEAEARSRQVERFEILPTPTEPCPGGAMAPVQDQTDYPLCLDLRWRAADLGSATPGTGDCD